MSNLNKYGIVPQKYQWLGLKEGISDQIASITNVYHPEFTI